MRPALSASGLGAAALCAGKPRMEAGLVDGDSAASLRGTNLHPYFRTSLDRSALPPADRELLAESDDLAESFLQTFREQVGIDADEPFDIQHEIELQGVVPGHPDCLMLWRRGSIAAILDLKSGMGQVEDAPSNLQLADYSALVWGRKPFMICGVAIVQPDAMGPRLTSAIYGAGQMPEVLAEIERIYVATLAKDAPLVAGEKQCRFCKAKTRCPEFTAVFSQLEIVPGTRAIQTLDNASLEYLHQIGQRWNQIEKEVKAELRERIRLGGMPGWELQSTGSVKTIADPAAAYRRLAEIFPKNETLAEDFMGCMKPTWEKLTVLSSALTGLPSKKARAKLEELFAGLIESTPKEQTPKKL